MLLDEMLAQGDWLFRWRSYLPLMIAPIFVLFFYEADWFHWSYSWLTEELWDAFCLLFTLLGFACRVMVAGYALKGTSGRNTVAQNASRLNSTGMYSIARHPLYLANFLIFVGFVLLFKSATLFLIAIMFFFLYYERIMLAEEAFLNSRFSADFRVWALRTPAFLPNISLWRRPDTEFSIRSTIRREHQTFLLIVSCFVAFEILDAIILEGRVFKEWATTEPYWLVAIGAAAAFYLISQFLKKRTRLLDVAGR